MAEGTSTFEGLSLPRLGEYEQVQQNLATDIVTITGSTGQSGDFIVCQDSDGTEQFVVSSSGLVSAQGASFSSSVGGFDLAISGTLPSNYGIKLTMGASAQAYSVIEYDAGIVADVTSFITIKGSLAPTYLFSCGGSAPDTGAPADNGFFIGATTLRTTAAISSDTEWGYAQIQNGSVVWNLLAYPATGMA